MRIPAIHNIGGSVVSEATWTQPHLPSYLTLSDQNSGPHAVQTVSWSWETEVLPLPNPSNPQQLQLSSVALFLSNEYIIASQDGPRWWL